MRPLSQAMCDRIKRLREFHSQAAVADILHITRNTVAACECRGFKEGHSGPPVIPMPDDFAIFAHKMTIMELREHYGRGQLVVMRWVRQLGNREYKPREVDRSKPIATPAEIQAAIAQHGVTKAAYVLGVHDGTLRKWRRLYRLPIRPRRKLAPTLAQRVAWVERYVAERRAA